MRFEKLLGGLCGLLFAAAGCSEETAYRLSDSVKYGGGAERRAESVRRSDFEKIKEAYLERAESRLNEIEADVEAMPPEVGNAGSLERRIAEVKEDLHDLGEVKPERWSEDRKRFETALTEVESEYYRLRRRMMES